MSADVARRPASLAGPSGPQPTTPLEYNRQAWDLLTSVHLGSSFYNVPAFRAGETSLKRPELEIVGDVRGQRLLHLQCHFGLDTLSWARRGARVTGVDFSAAAISAAGALAAEVGVEAEFIQADVQDLPMFRHQYDLVVSTYGVVCWLERLHAWTEGIHRALRPGGRFLLVDFHPVLEALHPDKMTGARGYFSAEEVRATWTDGSYAERHAPIRYREFRWQHPVGEVVTAVIDAGLELIHLREYPYSSYRLFEELEEYIDGVWCASAGRTSFPYMYSLAARKRLP